MADAEQVKDAAAVYVYGYPLVYDLKEVANGVEGGGSLPMQAPYNSFAYARHGRYEVDYPMEEYFERERPVVQELRRRLVELVESGRDVVLDYGLWRRSDRDAYKRLVEAHGGRWRLLYLKVDEPVDEGEECENQ